MEKRYAAMEQIAKAGILTGVSMMPILPGLCDTYENLEAIVRWTAPSGHGGKFVLAGVLTLADQQRDYFFGPLHERFPSLVPLHERLYPPGSHGAVRSGDPYAILPAHPRAVPAVWRLRPHAATPHPRRQAGPQQAHRRGVCEPVLLDGTGRFARAGAARVDLAQGGVGG